MGFRAQAIQKAMQPDETGKLQALASALSGMSASAGHFQGKMPESPGFKEAVNYLGDDRDIMNQIKLAGLADEEAALDKPIDDLSRQMLMKSIAGLPIDQTDSIELPEGMTRREIESNPVLGQLYRSITKDETKEPLKDQILRNQELAKQRRRQQPISDIDRKYLQKKLLDAGIDKTLPDDYTYGDVEDNVFFGQFKDNMKGVAEKPLTPYQRESLDLRKQAIEAQKVRQAEAKEERKAAVARAEKKETVGTATQNTAAMFADRIAEAEGVFDKLEKEGFDRTSAFKGAQSMLPNVVAGRLPGGSQLLQQEQAERNFINAVLRRESGAAIAESEFQNAEKQYFPRPGDSPEVVAQKKKNRELVLQGLRREAGPVLKQQTEQPAAPSEGGRREWTP